MRKILKKDEIAWELRNIILEGEETEDCRVKVRIFKMDRLADYIFKIYFRGLKDGAEKQTRKIIKDLKKLIY